MTTMNGNGCHLNVGPCCGLNARRFLSSTTKRAIAALVVSSLLTLLQQKRTFFRWIDWDIFNSERYSFEPPGGRSVLMHGLHELDLTERESMTWIEKGQWLVDSNKEILQASQERSMKSITLVTVLLDIGRGDLSGGFGRSFDEYIMRMEKFLHYDLPKVIFLDSDYVHVIETRLENSTAPYLIVPTSLAEIRSEFRHWDAVQAIRTNKTWSSQKGWLAESPQATLPFYNPLVMSKLALTLRASKHNPFKSDGFVFIDAGHLCHDPVSFSAEKITPFVEEGFLLTRFEYVPDGEVHGFNSDAFHQYTGSAPGPVLVARGGIFGGRPEHIAILTELMDLVAEETLSAGFMGTEENLLSIIYYRFSHIIRFYENGNRGNCGIFQEMNEIQEFNLRGLECATETNGQIACFQKGRPRQYCTSEVTPEFLTKASGQRSCQPNSGIFCVVNCTREGQVEWRAFNKSLCQLNPRNCPPEPKWIHKSKFELPPLLPTNLEPPECRLSAGGRWSSDPLSYWNATSVDLLDFYENTAKPMARKDTAVSNVSGLMLVQNTDRELRSAIATLETYVSHGLLSGIGEFLIWINGRNDSSVPVFQKFVQDYGVRILGSSQNSGQTWAINTLVELATKPYVLFLEKDFRLIEPWSCVVEQLSAGIFLIERKQADFVKYRHRRRPGHPNWAAILFRGNEEKVFKQQPNLLCNHYHWVEHPEERWPGKMTSCLNSSASPHMYCSDSRYCGFTLNPFLISRSFWLSHYSIHFPSWKVHDPYVNLEYYMNWEPAAWNNRQWVVAQGDGLFSHDDGEKWG